MGACSTDVLLNISSFWGCRVRPDIFLLRALPAADCDTKLLLSSSVLSSGHVFDLASKKHPKNENQGELVYLA